MIGNVKQLFDLNGKVAVVTGAGSGLGQGIAEGYAQMGASVSVVDIDAEAAQGVADGVNGAEGKPKASLNRCVKVLVSRSERVEMLAGLR